MRIRRGRARVGEEGAVDMSSFVFSVEAPPHLGGEEPLHDEVDGLVRRDARLGDERLESGGVRRGVVLEAAGRGLGRRPVAGHVRGDALEASHLHLLHELGEREGHEPGAVDEEHLVGLRIALLGAPHAVAPLQPARGHRLDGLRQDLHHLARLSVEHFVVRGGSSGRGSGARLRNIFGE